MPFGCSKGADTERVYIMGNKGYAWALLSPSSPYRAVLQSFGFTQQNVFQCTLEYLFRMPELSANATPLHYPDVHREVRAFKEGQDHASAGGGGGRSDSKNNNNIVIGVQIRVGDKIAFTNRNANANADGDGDADADAAGDGNAAGDADAVLWQLIDPFLQCYEEIHEHLTREHHDHDDAPLRIRMYLVSDSIAVKTMVQERYPQAMIDVTSEISHSGFGSDSYESAAMDMLTLSLSDYFVISKTSGFGQKAAFLNGAVFKRQSAVYVVPRNETCTPLFASTARDLAADWSAI